MKTLYMAINNNSNYNNNAARATYFCQMLG